MIVDFFLQIIFHAWKIKEYVSFCHSLAYFYTYNTMLINFSHCNNFTNQNLDSTQEAEIKCVIFVVIISPKTFFLRCS